MIYGNVFVLLEGNAIETIGKAEHAINHTRQFEIGPKHLRVDVVFLQLEFVRIESLVPLAHLEVFTFHLFRHFFQLIVLFDGSWLVCINEVVEQFVDILHLRCHSMLQHIVGVSAESQQLSNFATQVHQPLADVEIILAVLVSTYGVPCHI